MSAGRKYDWAGVWREFQGLGDALVLEVRNAFWKNVSKYAYDRCLLRSKSEPLHLVERHWQSHEMIGQITRLSASALHAKSLRLTPITGHVAAINNSLITAIVLELGLAGTWLASAIPRGLGRL